jgi:hypothetical protein
MLILVYIWAFIPLISLLPITKGNFLNRSLNRQRFVMGQSPISSSPVTTIFKGLDRLWLIRHCDKITDNNPCCSQTGYDRANHWYLYLKVFIDPLKLGIYTSNYNEYKQCIIDKNFKTNPNCQKSQRMYLTANAIREQYINTDSSLLIPINTNYCIGDYKDLLQEIKINTENYRDIIIVWEHNEIIEIIRDFGIEIKKWHNRWDDVYNLIFMIDIEQQKLYYDCYNFETDTYHCLDDIQDWLFYHDRIHNDIELGAITRTNTNFSFYSNDDKSVNQLITIQFWIWLIVIMSILLCGIGMSYFVYMCNKRKYYQEIREIQNKRAPKIMIHHRSLSDNIYPFTIKKVGVLKGGSMG